VHTRFSAKISYAMNLRLDFDSDTICNQPAPELESGQFRTKPRP